MENAIKRGRGRPPKPPGELKRAAFQTRMREALRLRLEAAAVLNGRSLSEEIEVKLEGSFDRIEASFGGAAGLDMAIMLYASFRFAGGAHAQARGHPEWTAGEWMRHAGCFEGALAQLVRSTWEHHPSSATRKDLLAWLEELHRRVSSQELTQQWNAEREAEAAADKPAGDEAA